jgi:hypothetical protein
MEKEGAVLASVVGVGALEIVDKVWVDVVEGTAVEVEVVEVDIGRDADGALWRKWAKRVCFGSCQELSRYWRCCRRCCSGSSRQGSECNHQVLKFRHGEKCRPSFVSIARSTTVSS